VETAMRETNLTEARIVSERARTTGHCRMFADLVEEGSWVDARIDTAQPNRMPAPKPDLRKMLVSLGPVVVLEPLIFRSPIQLWVAILLLPLAAGCPVL